MIHARLSTLVLSVLMLMDQTAAAALQFCDQNYLHGCEALRTEQCLEKYQACGEYDAIIQHYAAEDLTSSTQARYYKGVAYYGLYVRNRAASLKCQFSKVARSELAAFLYQSQDEGIKSPKDFDRVYQASKIIRELGKVTGCQENGITEDEIRFYAEQYADGRLKSLFIGSSKSDGLGDVVDDMKQTIQDTIGGFVTKATKIETQTQLRDTALRASQTRLAKIADLFDKNFGKSVLTLDSKGHAQSLQFTVDSSRNFRTAEANATAWRAKVGFIMDQLTAAFQGQNVNDYEKARKGFVDQARYVISGVAGYINMNQALVGTDASLALITEMGKPLDASSPLKTIQGIETAWRNSDQGAAECVFMDPKPWYCTTNAALLSPIPTP